MTARVVNYNQIECDSCGTCNNSVEPDATTARIAATKDGWRYIAWNIKGLSKRVPDPDRPDSWHVETVPRQWDCCPDCPLPESPQDAAKIRAGRKVQVRGAWQNRQ